MRRNPNIIIFVLKRVGEILVTTPSIRALKKSFPQAKITVVVDAPFFDVISDNPYVTDIIKTDPKSSWLENLRLGLKLRKQKFDLAIDYLANPRSAFLTFIIDSPIRIGLKSRIRRIAYNLTLRNFPDTSSYIADYRLNSVRLLGGKTDGLALDFFINPDQISQCRQFLSGYNVDLADDFVTISPISLRIWKLWPFEEFAKTADYIINEYKLTLLLICGPGEYHYLTQVKDLMESEPAALIEFTSLKSIGYTLSKSCLHIGNDGGLNHLSAAVKTPTITIYGAGKASKWNNNQDPKLIAITKKIACRSKKCYRTCQFDYQCLKMIKFADLKDPIDKLLLPINRKGN
jgi:ADP-heptose:LPS heptosyltransferase